jgi:iron complex outermembrane recepter protein
MNNVRPLTRAVGLICMGASLVGLPNEQALAQEEAIVEEVFVTGSRIQKSNLVSSSPVTQIDSEELRFQGTVRVEDLLRNMPQIYSTQNTGQSNGATGTATLDLRKLGDERTLVLVNGRRLPAGSPLDEGTGADINQIPGALIKRVEVLTGGASATYGSDAVAGVVNFIMMDDFQGFKLDYQASQYQHDNDNGNV